jgi:ABC-type branched-subunit amino acid transport system ATPase component
VSRSGAVLRIPPEASRATLLSVRDVRKSFGGVVALTGVDLDVPERAISSLIGPNGAGKSTLFNVITGQLRPDAGSINYGGRQIQGKAPAQIARIGIARTFQHVRLFTQLNVLENVMVAAHWRRGTSWAEMARPLLPGDRSSDTVANVASEYLRLVGLESRASHAARDLSLLDQRRLEIARALAIRPKLLLLDESFAGSTSGEATALMETLHEVARDGVTILLIEHNVDVVMELSEWVTVLDFGRVIASGPPAYIQGDRAVIRAYFGTQTGD